MLPGKIIDSKLANHYDYNQQTEPVTESIAKINTNILYNNNNTVMHKRFEATFTNVYTNIP